MVQNSDLLFKKWVKKAHKTPRYVSPRDLMRYYLKPVVVCINYPYTESLGSEYCASDVGGGTWVLAIIVLLYHTS